MHTNKHNYIDQMVNREILERVHERMNDELITTANANLAEEGSEGQSTGTTPCVNPCTENLPDDWCHISQDQSQKIYLPRFLNESQNTADPAFKVSTGDMQMYSEFQTLTNLRVRTFIRNS